MTSPRYPLRAALEQRRALVEQARRALAEAIRAAAAEERRRQAAQKERDAFAARCEKVRRGLYEPDEKGQLPVAEVSRRADGLRHCEEKRDEATARLHERERAVAEAEESVAAGRRGLVAAEAELKVVEKHHDDWLAAERREARRREERLVEEVVQARHAAARVDGEATTE